ncbi:MAG: PAS domain S-box protein [Chitinophagia bacterium]|nr:PAS domain S-box protein [Chitinophagia bacterium]
MNEFGRNKKAFFLLCSFLVFVSGALAIIGYLFHIPALYAAGTNATLNPFTAICFMAIGNWMYLVVFQREVSRLLYYPVVAITYGISLLKLAEMSGIFPIHFDQYFFLRALNNNEPFDGISPPSALLLLFCAITLTFFYSRNKAILLLADIFKIVGFLTAYLVVVGYVFNAMAPLYQAQIPTMAFNTAITYVVFYAFTLVGFPHGAILQVFDAPYIGGSIARRTAPFILVIPVIAGYLYLLAESNEKAEPMFATALLVLFSVFLTLLYVYLLANRLNKQDLLKHQAEQKVAESEERHRTLLAALREGIVYYNDAGTVLYCNDAFSQLTGYTTAQILGGSIFDLFIRDEDTEKYRARMQDRKAGISEVFEDKIKTKAGEYKWVSISACPVRNEKGEVIAALSTLVDITEKKKQLEDIEAFSASAAHDLNAPLARIEMIAMLMLETAEDQLDTDNLDLLKAIAGITYNMRNMLRDLLNFSKLGIAGIKKDKIDTGQLVADAVAATRFMNEKAVVTIGELPPLHGDEVMIRQVLVNLIGNALKYSAHREQPRVDIGSSNEQGRQVIFVKDNGAGFNMEQYHKLFAAFQRLHVEFEGNGLGLPIVKRIVEKHGGNIWAEGIEGQGATFYFSLP